MKSPITIDFLEHVVHRLDIVVVQVPYTRVFVILFKRDCESKKVQINSLDYCTIDNDGHTTIAKTTVPAKLFATLTDFPLL